MGIDPPKIGSSFAGMQEAETSRNLLVRREGAFRSSTLSPFQSQVDQLVSGFVLQAADWKSLASMTAAGLAYRVGRIGSQVSGYRSLVLGSFPSRFLSVAAGLSAEVSTFELANRGLTTLSGRGVPINQGESNLWRWSGPNGLRQGLLSSFITFASLKSLGRLAEGQNLILRHGAQDAGMVFGHQLGHWAGLGPKPEGSLAEQFLHAEAMNLQVGAGMALGHSLTGGRLQIMERGVDLTLPSLHAASKGGSSSWFGSPLLAAGIFQQGRMVENPLSHLVFIKESSPASGKEGPARRETRFLSNRLLIQKLRDGDREAAQELCQRARREPRQFFRSSDLEYTIGSLYGASDRVIRRRLLETIHRIIDGSWGIISKRNVETIRHFYTELPFLSRDMNDLLKKIQKLRPDLISDRPEGNQRQESDKKTRFEKRRERERSSMCETLSSARFSRIEITSKTIRVEGTLRLFHESTYSQIPVRFEGDLGTVLKQGRSLIRFPPAQRDWFEKIEKGAVKARRNKGRAQNALNRLVQGYLDDAAFLHSSFPIDSRWFRLLRLAASETPEIHEALRKLDISPLIGTAKNEKRMHEGLFRLALLGHPQALAGLVELTNGGSEWARLSLRVLEIRDLAASNLKSDFIAQSVLEGWARRSSLSREERDALIEGFLKIAERALASGEFKLADYAFLRLYQMKSTDEEGRLLKILQSSEGSLFESLKSSSLSMLSPFPVLKFLKEASLASPAAVQALALLGRQHSEVPGILEDILSKIPFEEVPAKVEINEHLKMKGIIKIHRELQKQAIRNQVLEALSDLANPP